MTKTYSMPKDFYWGGASAANQYEGGYKRRWQRIKRY